MSATLLDGKKASESIQLELKNLITASFPEKKRAPGLAVILVGNDPASEIYVNKKKQACEAIGIRSEAFQLDADSTQAQLVALIQQLNERTDIDGILVQMPLPEHFDSSQIIETIKPTKDVDGFHPYNVGRLALRLPTIRPCTPFGIMKLLEFYRINTYGLKATIVGASNIVGRPMGLELLLAGSTVTTCHRFTKDLEHHVKDAELLIVAVGKRHIVKSEWVQKNTIVIDVGIHRLEDKTIVGDLNFPELVNKVSYITPVPGGVGPMTVTMLLWNTVQVWLNSTL